MTNAIYVGYDGVTPATLLPEAVRELRDGLDFEGAILSADLVATTATAGGTVGEAAVNALKAGVDLLVIPGGRAQQDQAFRAVVAAVQAPATSRPGGSSTRWSGSPSCAGSRARRASRSAPSRPWRGYRRRRPANALPSVTSSAYSRSPPTGSPLASRVTTTSGVRSRSVVGDVQRGRLAGRRRVRRQHDLADRDGRVGHAGVELGDLQVVGIDPVDRRQRAAEHVVAARELVRALDRDDVAGLLDDADERPRHGARRSRRDSAGPRRS